MCFELIFFIYVYDMKLNFDKIELKNVSPNIFQIKHNNSDLKFWTPPILAPFGIDNEYNKYLLKMEIDEEKHFHLKKIINHIEKIIKKKLEMEEDSNEFKSVLKKRFNKSDLLECRIKTMKSSILTNIEYEDKENNYLKTIFDLPKQNYIKAQIEIYGFFDYRNEKKEKNKIGLIIYVNKIIILK